MTAKATIKKTPQGGEEPRLDSEAELKHYSPEQIEEKGLLPFKASTIRAKCHAREWPHNGGASKVTLKLWQIREISERYDIPPAGATAGSKKPLAIA